MELKLVRSFELNLPRDNTSALESFDRSCQNSWNGVQLQSRSHPVLSHELFIEESLVTKREILSDAAKTFDPLSLISCVTAVAKIIFQRLWERGTAWDEPLSPEIQNEWLYWRTGRPEISNIRIPCCYTPVSSNVVVRQLIGFSDAARRHTVALVLKKP